MIWLLRPPEWAVITIVIVGLALIWLDLKRPWRGVPSASKPVSKAAEAQSALPAPPPVPILITCEFVRYPCEYGGESELHNIDFFYAPNDGLILRSLGMSKGRTFNGEWGTPEEVTQHAIAYRCEITNFGDEAIFDLRMSFPAEFREIVSQPEGALTTGQCVYVGDWDVTIPHVDPGKHNSFVLYLFSQGPYYVVFHIPERESYLSGNEEGRREAKMLSPNRTFTRFSPNQTALRAQRSQSAPET